VRAGGLAEPGAGMSALGAGPGVRGARGPGFLFAGEVPGIARGWTGQDKRGGEIPVRPECVKPEGRRTGLLAVFCFWLSNVPIAMIRKLRTFAGGGVEVASNNDEFGTA
jgi:hypothetical protein